MLIIKCEKQERRKEKKRKKKKKIFGVLITQNPAAVFRRSPEFAPSDRHDFWTEASLHIKEGFHRWDLDFEAWKFCFLPGQIASCLVIFFLPCSLFVAIYLDIDSKIMMIVKGKMEDPLYVKDYYLPVFSTEKPKNKTDAEWTILHRQVCGYIRQWVDDNVLNHICEETHARTLWNKLEQLYARKTGNNKFFVGNISRRCVEKSNGLLDVQKQLCDDISKASSIPVHDVSVYTSTIENALARKKVFIVLDDIDSLDQLDVLLGNKGFHPGSKIIITTKDASLTERCALFNPQVQPKHTKHNLKGLHVIESLKLLCLHAFKSEDLKEGYEAVSDNIVNYCEGHPLALKVLGRLLHERDVAYWEDCIEGLKKEPDFDINNVLRMSFNSLPSENDKELFKHIACFFVGKISVPSELPMENLVALDMSYSNIEFFDMSCSSHQRNAKRQKLTGSCSKAKRLLGSLKILDLSFSEQLRGVGGFCELPSLESLFLSNCSSLIEICESIDHCDELVFIDLSNCKDLRELPRTLAKLKKVKTLLLDGCNKGELAVVEAVQRDFKSSAVYFPSSLVMLSLANNNLSNESFPMDLSCLSMLKELCLDGNPIVSMPDCVRTLPRLEILDMENCAMLGSIEHPPRTLLSLRINSRHMSCIRKISFDQEMSPLDLQTTLEGLAASSIEIEGIIKIQPIAGVDDTILCSLGWSNLEFLNKRRVGTYQHGRVPEGSRTQMYYEHGIFSTIYGGKVMPTWIARRRKGPGPSISFTIPSSPNKLRGLNFCCISRFENGIREYPLDQSFDLPHIKIRNITKNLTWLYKHHLDRVNVGGKSLTFLSHWMFGENEMEDGDQLTISIKLDMMFGENEMEEDDDQDGLSRVGQMVMVYDQMPEPRWVISMGSWDVRSDAEALLYGLLQLYMRRDRNKISSKAVLIL
ncbi:Toll/interleukin-1 receptor domain-containing protein [Tanacetum coccineum]|uniref:Toll/interleukin-1 receptor domain-containing protein n=1 Tax=Tanacetum coccineum TaxID=301880 RepID=A0ABQ5EEP3_9ASTR